MTPISNYKDTDLKKTFLAPFQSKGLHNLLIDNDKIAIADVAVEALDLPHTKIEAWKYTSLKPIISRVYQKTDKNTSNHLAICEIPDLNAYTLTFVNGLFATATNEEYKDKRLIVKSFSELQEEEIPIVEKYFANIVLPDKDIFTALNTAYASQGLFIYVPAGHYAAYPIHLQHIVDTEEDIAFQYRNLVIVGENAGLKIVETYHSSSTAHTFRNAVTEVFVASEANLEYVKFLNEGDAASHIENITIVQGKQSQTAIYTVALSGEIVRNNLSIKIAGDHASAILNGASLLSNNQHIDNHTEVHHEMPHCTSSELYKAIIGDSATSVFNGKIQVYRDAQKTAAYQSNRNILLSDTANIYTKPQLEIYADDVKCSHGATTGQMNEDALFYLRARGIKEEDARKLLVQAFLQDTIETISMLAVKEYLHKQIESKLS